jgi:hypothetical protein
MEVTLSLRHVEMIRHAISPRLAISSLRTFGLPLSSTGNWDTNSGGRLGEAEPCSVETDSIFWTIAILC